MVSFTPLKPWIMSIEKNAGSMQIFVSFCGIDKVHIFYNMHMHTHMLHMSHAMSNCLAGTGRCHSISLAPLALL